MLNPSIMEEKSFKETTVRNLCKTEEWRTATSVAQSLEMSGETFAQSWVSRNNNDNIAVLSRFSDLRLTVFLRTYCLLSLPFLRLTSNVIVVPL